MAQQGLLPFFGRLGRDRGVIVGLGKEAINVFEIDLETRVFAASANNATTAIGGDGEAGLHALGQCLYLLDGILLLRSTFGSLMTLFLKGRALSLQLVQPSVGDIMQGSRMDTAVRSHVPGTLRAMRVCRLS